MLKKMPKEMKNKIIISLCLLIALILIVIGISYATFRFIGTGEKINQITTASISMDYKETDNVISLNNALPTTDATGKVRLKEGEYFDFSITTKVLGNAIINWEIAAEDFEDNTFDGSNVKYYLTKIVDGSEIPVNSNLPKVYTEDTTMNKYTGRPANMMSLLVGSTSTRGVETTNYRLRLYVDEAYNPQGDGGGLIYKTKINVYGSDTVWHQITADSDVTVEKDAIAGKTVHFEVVEKEGYTYNGAQILNTSGTVIGTVPNNLKEFVMPEEAISIKILWKSKEPSVLKKEFLDSSISKESITKIVTKNNTTVPSSATKSWDVSEAGDGGVIAYLEGTEGSYTLTIGGNEKILAPTDSSQLFMKFSKVTNIDLTYLDTSNVTSMVAMFSACSTLTTLNINNFDTAKVEKMNSMFTNCSSLISLDLTHFNTENVNSMALMFRECRSLTFLNLGSFNTSKVEMMQYMFYNCQNLTNLDLRSFNTSAATNMNQMFYQAGKLTSIMVSSVWNTSNATTDRMFNNCGTDHVTVVS